MPDQPISSDAAAPAGVKRPDPSLASFRQMVAINAAVTLTVSSVVTLLLLDQLPAAWMAAWWLAHVVPSGYMIVRWLLRPRRADGSLRQRSPAEQRRVRRLDTLGAAFSGGVWGAAALFLPQLDQQHQMLLIMVAAGMIAGSAATLAVLPRAAIAYITLTGGPYVIFLLLQGSMISIGMALLAMLYLCAMLLTNRIVNGVIRRNARLLEENTTLYQRIRDAQTELLNIAESTEAFALLDDAGRLQLWNRRFPELLGIDGTALQRGEDLEAQLNRAGLPDALLTSRIAGGLLQLPRTRRWVQISHRVTPQGDAALILLDITDQQEASAQLHSQNARLEELFREVSQARDAALRASQAKSIFLANMSHELRTPLNAIIGFSDIVQKKMFGPASDKYDEYLNDINGSARHLLSVIDDILDLARIEANQIVLSESPVHLDEEIPICARLAASHYGRSSGAVSVHLPPELPALQGDARLIRQVVLNLIGNALKFTPGQEPVEAGAHLDAATGEIVLWVRDTGIGIPPEDQVRIFEPFEQADTQLSRNFGGVGLGLSLVRAFVLAHQGRLAVDSAPGRGTTITATFPAGRTGPL